MTLSEIHTNQIMDKFFSISWYDVKVFIAIVFSAVMLTIAYKIYAWFGNSHKALVESGQITDEKFVKMAIWPIVFVVIIFLMMFSGLYTWFYMPF